MPRIVTRVVSTRYPDRLIDRKHRFGVVLRVAVGTLLLLAVPAMSEGGAPNAQDPATARPPQLKVFLDCNGCFTDFLRTEVTFVDYVRDRAEADVHVLITSIETGSGGREYTAAFTGLKAHAGTDRTIRTVTTRADPEDVVRRQLANALRVGVLNYVVATYNELTLFQKLEETLPVHELSLTFEQRDRWGTLEARGQWSQYLHQLDKSRFEVEADVSVRVTRGLSIGAELNASRIRDQISLPARGASPEEILLRQRQLRSGYEYDFGVSITYSFGSIFSSIVNPRFGQ